ncbi:hypothetical protein [Pseudomonas versuta]|nr:hypothetical protein [Pseudomonas versuta]
MNLTPTTIKAAAKFLAREFHFSASEIEAMPFNRMLWWLTD